MSTTYAALHNSFPSKELCKVLLPYLCSQLSYAEASRELRLLFLIPKEMHWQAQPTGFVHQMSQADGLLLGEQAWAPAAIWWWLSPAAPQLPSLTGFPHPVSVS